MGGNYNGNSIRLITEPATLIDLEEMLPEKYSKPVCEYLKVIRKIYELSMADDLDPEYYSEQFREFKRTFLVLHKLIKLPWTLKVLKICLWTLDMKGIICRFILLVSITRNTSNCVVPPSNTAVESILKQCIVD